MKFPSVLPRGVALKQFHAANDLFKQMTPAARVVFGFELNNVVRRLREKGVRFRHPEYNEEQVRLAVIRINLGPKLFREVYGDVDIKW